MVSSERYKGTSSEHSYYRKIQGPKTRLAQLWPDPKSCLNLQPKLPVHCQICLLLKLMRIAGMAMAIVAKLVLCPCLCIIKAHQHLNISMGYSLQSMVKERRKHVQSLRGKCMGYFTLYIICASIICFVSYFQNMQNQSILVICL